MKQGAAILDGKATAASERQKTALRAGAFASKFGRKPGLAVVQVGEDPASTVYVRNKRKSCAEVGIESTLAGNACCLFSETSAAAVTCGIMNPELRPGLGVRNAGSADSAGSINIAIRRSAIEPISHTAMAIMSAAKATGSA